MKNRLSAMKIYRGVTVFFRNATGHNLVDEYSQEDALRFVVFIDLLLAIVGRISDQQDTSEV
jgi:hypothetical protein